MSKTRLQNTLIKLKKNLSEMRPNLKTEIIYNCLTKGRVPKDKKLKELVRLLEDGIYVDLCGGAYPSMPSDSWSKENGDQCQPDDWKEPIPYLKADKPSIIKMAHTD